MNTSKLINIGTTFTDSGFYKITEFTGADATIITTSITNNTCLLYSSGSIKAGELVFQNPIGSSTFQFPIIVSFARGNYVLSYDKRFILKKETASYTLFYNSVYSPDFIEYSNTNPTEARTIFTKYCQFTNFADSNCACVVIDNNDVCMTQQGWNISSYSDVIKSSLRQVCPCVNSSCNLDSMPHKFLQDTKNSCPRSIAICNVTFDTTSSTMNNATISQACGASNVENTSTTPTTSTTSTTSTTTVVNPTTTVVNPTTTVVNPTTNSTEPTGTATTNRRPVYDDEEEEEEEESGRNPTREEENLFDILGDLCVIL